MCEPFSCAPFQIISIVSLHTLQCGFVSYVLSLLCVSDRMACDVRPTSASVLLSVALSLAVTTLCLLSLSAVCASDESAPHSVTGYGGRSSGGGLFWFDEDAVYEFAPQFQPPVPLENVIGNLSEEKCKGEWWWWWWWWGARLFFLFVLFFSSFFFFVFLPPPPHLTGLWAV
jgi:hypothetical protein